MLLFKHLQKRTFHLLGIDIQPTDIRVLEMCREKQQVLVTAISKISSLDEDPTVAIIQALKQNHINSTKIAFAIPDSEVVAKNIHLDTRLTETEIWQQVQTSAYQYLSLPSKELCLDYIDLGIASHHPQLRTIRWVAAKRHAILARQDMAKKLGLIAAFVEVESAALERVALQQQKGVLPADLRSLHNKTFTEDFSLSLGLALRVMEL